MNPWQWLLKQTGATQRIEKLSSELKTAKETVKTRDASIVNLHKIYVDTMDARDAWRDTAAEYRRSEQNYKRICEKLRDDIPTLIRYDRLHTVHGTCGMVSDNLGEFVKYKALENLFLNT